MVVAFILPALIFVTGVAVPLGIMPAEVMSYDRIHAFAGSWFGKLFIFLVISLTLWHGFHRIFLSLHDLGITWGHMFFKVMMYGIAGIGTLYSLLLVAGI